MIGETKRYISERNFQKLADGWSCTVPDRTPVMLSKVSNKDFASAILADGKRDFAGGVNILEDAYFDKAVYHFQQSVEKAVKAILICFGIFKKHILSEEFYVKNLKKENLLAAGKKNLYKLPTQALKLMRR